MTAAQFEVLADAEADEVVRWRFSLLLRAGFEDCEAIVLASNTSVDVHVAEDLVRRGCPPGTALRILI
jgi:hypothetical protein